jgi:hypothetical protein
MRGKGQEFRIQKSEDRRQKYGSSGVQELPNRTALSPPVKFAIAAQSPQSEEKNF